MIAFDTLELVGEPLFSAGLLSDHLEERVRAQVTSEYLNIYSPRRRISKLQLRRRFEGACFGGAVTLQCEPKVRVLGARLPDGRHVAEYRSLIEGDPGYLSYAPLRAMMGRRPVASADGHDLVLAARFASKDRPFVAALIEAELETIQAALATQRAVLERFNNDLPVLVRRLVLEEWPRLTAGR